MLRSCNVRYCIAGHMCAVTLPGNLFFSLQEDPPAGVSGAPSENNIMVWNAVIFGFVPFSFFLTANRFVILM